MSVRVPIGAAVMLAVALSPLAAPRAISQESVPGTAPGAAPGPLDWATVLTWRPIGPSRAGHVTAVTGDPGRPGTFYAAAAGGGVWRTRDYGASWTSLFDAPPSGFATAVATAPSVPQVIYASASGGRAAHATLWTSSDDGRSWRPAGTTSWRALAQIVVDPINPQHLLVTGERADEPVGSHGLYRSHDGGATFDRVLTMGFGDSPRLTVHPYRPGVIFAVGSSVDPASGRRRTHVFRSTDTGATWHRADLGLPALQAADGLHVVLAAAPDAVDIVVLMSGPDGARFFRSLDLGDTWDTTDSDLADLLPAGRFPALALSSSGTLRIVAGQVWESLDGGRTFEPMPGVPAGRDDNMIWQHPSTADVMIVAGRDGAIVTVNGGQSWSPAEALAGASVRRVVADTAFPYRVCAELDSGILCGPSRSETDGPTARDWRPLPAALTGAIPDPTNAETVFGGNVLRYDRQTGQTLDVGQGELSVPQSRHPAALAFSADGRTLLAGTRSVWRTTNGGQAWIRIGPDLRETPPAGAPNRISSLSLSQIDNRTIWVGLDDGSIHVTRDSGTTWHEHVLPARERGPVHRIEPSRFDASSAYAIVGPTHGHDATTTLLRTRDGGETWTDIGAHITGADIIYTVREDPLRRGLLFAGTDRAVVVSFDDGERWKPLQLNLPASPVQDLFIKDADLIAGTGGRGVWILDDLSPLREFTSDVARAPVFLFRPAQAWRIRASTLDSHSAADPHAGRGGVYLTYLLGSDLDGDLTLEVIETTTSDVIRRFTSRPPADSSAAPLPATAGLHRVHWDLRYAPPDSGSDRTPGTPVVPGTYQVRLTSGARSVRQAVTIRMDPRIRTSIVDLIAQRDLGRAVDAARAALADWLARAPAAGVSPAVDLRNELDQMAALIQQADVRPSARLEAAVEAALERVAHLLGARAEPGF